MYIDKLSKKFQLRLRESIEMHDYLLQIYTYSHFSKHFQTLGPFWILEYSSKNAKINGISLTEQDWGISSKFSTRRYFRNIYDYQKFLKMATILNFPIFNKNAKNAKFMLSS